MRRIRLAMAQINPTVGALGQNSKKIIEYAEKARRRSADIVIFPELALTGYPPEDLLLKPRFIDDNLAHLKALAKRLGGITAIVGFVDRATDIYNAAAVIHGGKVAGVYHKMYLPNYGVFDEERYFQAGSTPLNIVLDGVIAGVEICEDIWYPEGPARAQSLAGAELILNINASPYHMGKVSAREEMLKARAMDNDVIVAYCNTVGAQDELVFDGQSMIIDEHGRVAARGRAFEEELITADLDIGEADATRLHDARMKEARRKEGAHVEAITLKAIRRKARPGALRPSRAELPEPVEEVLDALVLGTKDYVRKNGFRRAVIGLSGGVDSCLVASIAVRALGRKNVTGVFMPSKYTSKESREDAALLAENLGIELMDIPIRDAFDAYLKMLKGAFRGRKADITEENLQARVRGNILMALSNKFGWLVLTTGNKSEMGVGYATLYGDMAGGFAVIKDVPKMLVYELCRRINARAGKTIIPGRVFTKAPSAELKPRQTDQDSLPPYDKLDRILKAYVEDDRSPEEIIAMGFDKRTVQKVARMVDLSEYKRRQAPPGIKITPRAFGKDRRMPITNGYENIPK